MVNPAWRRHLVEKKTHSLNKEEVGYIFLVVFDG